MNQLRRGLLLAAVCVGAGALPSREASAQGGVSVAGTWSTQFAGAAATVVFSQSGQNVVGTYVNTPPLMPGGIAGVLRGNVLTGRWTDASSSGGFVMAFSPDGRSFAGTWGRDLSSSTNGGPWLGRRQ